jgi:hypothetical protein
VPLPGRQRGELDQHGTSQTAAFAPDGTDRGCGVRSQHSCGTGKVKIHDIEDVSREDEELDATEGDGETNPGQI